MTPGTGVASPLLGGKGSPDESGVTGLTKEPLGKAQFSFRDRSVSSPNTPALWTLSLFQSLLFQHHTLKELFPTSSGVGEGCVLAEGEMGGGQGETGLALRTLKEKESPELTRSTIPRAVLLP